MTEPQDVLAERGGLAAIQARDEAGQPLKAFDWHAERGTDADWAMARIFVEETADDRRTLLALVRTPETLDVERLMEAMNEAFTYEDRDNAQPTLPFVDDVETFWTPFAEKVAAEYAALAAQSPAPPEGLRTLEVEAVVRAMPGYVQSTTVGDDDSVTSGMEPDDGSGLWQGAWVQKGVVIAALRDASDMAGHRIREAHDCFLMNCRYLGDEVERLQGRLAASPSPVPPEGLRMPANAIGSAILSFEGDDAGPLGHSHLWFCQCSDTSIPRHSCAVSPAPDPGAGLREATVQPDNAYDGLYQESGLAGAAPSAEPPETA